MDKDVLTNILNRLEDKVDIMSTGLTNNTAVTQSHTKMLSDMKGVHDINASVILEMRDQMKDLKNDVLKINSWKDGQIEYQSKVLTDVRALQAKIEPLHLDFLERTKKKEQNDTQLSKIGWSALEKVILIVAGAFLISIPAITKIIYANIFR